MSAAEIGFAPVACYKDGVPTKAFHSFRVAVLIEASNAYGRGLLKGIHRFVRVHEPWTIFLPEHGRGTPPLEQLAQWHGDGILARIETPAIADVLGRIHKRQGTPIVDVSAARLLPRIPYVETDDAAIGQIAAHHFVERDFRHFGFVGDRRFRWSKNRCDAFIKAVTTQGYQVHVFPETTAAMAGVHAESANLAAEDDLAIEEWVRECPKPFAVFASYDTRGQQVLEACRRAGIKVPDEVAVLGVDNDELLCELAAPSLSSVIPDAAGAGELAAGILEQLMRGGNLTAKEWLLPPTGIATRGSSDVLAIDDVIVVAAIRFIRVHACRGIKVGDIVTNLKVSRRVLEKRFLSAVGHTPHEEILRVQFRRIEQLLRETDLPLASIAFRCGFQHPEYMTVVFTRRYGMPPSRWRSQQLST